VAVQERLPHDKIVEDLARSFEQAQRTIMAQLKAAVQSGNVFKAAERRMQLAAVVATLDQLGAAVQPEVRRVVADAFNEGANKVTQQIGAQVGREPLVPATFNGVSIEAITQLQVAAVDRINAANRLVGRRVEDFYAQAGRRAAVRRLLGADGSAQTAAKNLRADMLKNPEVQKLFKDGVTGFEDRAGKKWALQTYSEMVVRTTTREAVVQGQLLRMASHGVNLGRISTHSSACKLCAPYQGVLFSLDGTVTEYQGESVADQSSLPMPPFHPNCRHTVEPVVSEFDSFLKGRATAPPPTQLSFTDRVDQLMGQGMTQGQAQTLATQEYRAANRAGIEQPAGATGSSHAVRQTPGQVSAGRGTPTNDLTKKLGASRVPRFSTISDARDWVSNNIADELRVTDQHSLETVQDLVDGIDAVIGGTDIRLTSIEPFTRGKKAYAFYHHARAARAGKISMRDDLLRTDRSWNKALFIEDGRTAETWTARRVTVAEQKLADATTGQARGAANRKLKELAARDRWVIGQDANTANPIKVTGIHEAGHALMYETPGFAKRWQELIAGIPKLERLQVSEYAAKNMEELFAETISAVLEGTKVPPSVRTAYETVLREFGYAK